jgi:hypothetical protein
MPTLFGNGFSVADFRRKLYKDTKCRPCGTTKWPWQLAGSFFRKRNSQPKGHRSCSRIFRLKSWQPSDCRATVFSILNV